MGAFRKSTGVVEYGGIDRANWRVPVLLTAAVDDYDGDLVHPEAFLPIRRSRLYANLEHDSSTNHYGELKTLALKDIDHDGATVRALHGWSHFDRNNAEARQAFGLVEVGVKSGFSVEFDPDPNHPPIDRGVKSIRQHDLKRPRNAFEFRKGILLGGAHCEQPVCPLAGVVLPDPDQVKAFGAKIARDQRINGEQLLPAFAKAVEKFRPPVTVRVPGSPDSRKTKAMEPDLNAPVPTPVDQPPIPDPEPPVEDAPAEKTVPERDEAHDGAQMLLDIAQRLRDVVGNSLHGKSKKMFPKFADQIEKMAAQLSDHGDAVHGELGGDGEGEGDEGEETDGGDSAPEFAPDDDAKEVAKSFKAKRVQDGNLVTPTGRVAKSLKQFTASQVRPVAADAEAAAIYRAIVQGSDAALKDTRRLKKKLDQSPKGRPA